jgi:hypothetical protein
MLGAAGETETADTGTSVTVIVAVPVMPSLVALTLVVPTLTPDTTPLELTDATPGFALVQLITRPVRTALFASRVTALNCTAPPRRAIAGLGETLTDATDTVGTGATVTVTEA